MNIILICYKLSPSKGSEYAIAWNFIRQMSKYHHFYVLYGTDGTSGGDEMDKWINNNPEENINYCHVALPSNNPYANFTKWLYRHEKYVGFYLMYKIWHKEAYNTALKIMSECKIDLIHYLTLSGFKEPGLCWKIKDVPYVWGPVQGVENWPICLYKAITVKGKIEAIYRLIAHNAVLLGSIKVRKAVARADYIFGSTPKTLTQFKTLYGKTLDYLPEHGIVGMNVQQPIQRLQGEPLQIFWAGKFEDRKCVHLLLMALGKLKAANWQLTLCGTGPLQDEVNNTILRLGIKDQISLKGKVSRDEVQQCFKNSHLHIISSMSEETTTVLFEAMSWGVPTLTLDHCGMGGVVCERCGIKIPIRSYNQVIGDMASAIKDMIDNPSKVNMLSKGVMQCSKQYLWEERVKKFNEVYNNLINKREIKLL